MNRENGAKPQYHRRKSKIENSRQQNYARILLDFNVSNDIDSSIHS